MEVNLTFAENDLLTQNGPKQVPTLRRSLDFENLGIPEEDLAPARRAIYHSEGPGYFVFRNFLSPALARHVKSFWQNLDQSYAHKPFPGMAHMAKGCPNFYYGEQGGNRGYFNFFWNHPVDEATYAASFQVQWLRNRVMGRTPFEEIFPLYGRSTCYRVVISQNGDNIIPPHRDWSEDFFVREPARLQATLFLGLPGVDYVGDGFIFENNQGKKVVFGRDVQIESGDLVLWRYSNEHAVANVRSKPGQAGFMRILFEPDEIFEAAPPEARRPLNLDTMINWVAHTSIGQSAIRPLYRKLRGRK
jgi:hypothetical protein